MRLRTLSRMITAVVVLAGGCLVLNPVAADAAPNSGNWLLQNYATGKCLVVRGDANGARVTHTPCANYNDQYFTFQAIGRTWYGYQVYRLRSINSGKCVVARSSNYLAVQTTCADYADQHWVVQNAVDDPAYFLIVNTSSNRCLAHQASGTQAFVTARCGYHDQWWHQVLRG